MPISFTPHNKVELVGCFYDIDRSRGLRWPALTSFGAVSPRARGEPRLRRSRRLH